MLGFPAQDIAIVFYHARGLPNFSELYQAFKDGYASNRTWPISSLRQVDNLIMARLLVLLNFCCNRLHWDDIAGWRNALANRLEQLVHECLN